MLRRLQTIAGLRVALSQMRNQKTIGLVPTMGALHQGHQSLIERAIAENDLVVVSIFVNPLQFSPTEDLERYPRDLNRDCQFCEALGVQVVFAPTPQAMGIAPQAPIMQSETTLVIPPTSMIQGLCGAFRQGHFEGVATIVTKLLNIVQPTRAYFGEKDAQQLAIIRRLVRDLQIPVEIRGCPIVREASGLALSSRNQYLTPAEQPQALVLSRSLKAAKQAFQNGERSRHNLLHIAQIELATTPQVRVQYLELVAPDTLEPLETIETAGLLAIAAFVGKTRLIDNVILQQRQPIIAIDGPAGAGKSTVTRRVADALNLTYLDTGAMYRAITWLVLQAQIPLDDEIAIAELVSSAKIEFRQPYPNATPRVFANDRDVTEAIRSTEVTANVSAIARLAAVRAALVSQQQRFGKKGGLVAEGRDIGTNVFPDAEYKIYLTASVPERARRRLKDLHAQGETQIDLTTLEQDIQKRDYLDSTRAIAPLRQAHDAIEVVTDGLSLAAVTQRILQIVTTLPNP
ncbi:MAG: bifunctional pantoate--beta-alanine ligase/(d)CMP kinase [Jaaginema sp. PMC 1079.18]|nr:bifunctional pantoate--beta-alanine ligase/(d)CMP kinase [Jaaginema sp. PMC 1080.18]MEC4851729.1 bifunctional pantoate--beta-alanine ligase/(d)CMP kinase [Jaaginema sp. PMC 1079.18]MEC4865800.1 bifunctional pantoate--beta-alanine ligase/(d)CMP kinase [Jaaginema sp. PMC 1078.18]